MNFFVSVQRDYIPCAFRLTISTLPEPTAGTTSNVSITVGDKEGNRVVIPNVVEWNRLQPEPGHVYFQSGQVDKFLGTEDCYALASHPCFINITISGTGDNPTWGCGDIMVDAPPVGDNIFYIREWLTPEINYSVERQLCPPPSKGMTSCTTGSLAI